MWLWTSFLIDLQITLATDSELPGIIAESGFLQLMSEAGESRIISVSEKCQLIRFKKDNMLWMTIFYLNFWNYFAWKTLENAGVNCTEIITNQKYPWHKGSENYCNRPLRNDVINYCNETSCSWWEYFSCQCYSGMWFQKLSTVCLVSGMESHNIVAASNL